MKRFMQRATKFMHVYVDRYMNVCIHLPASSFLRLAPTTRQSLSYIYSSSSPLHSIASFNKSDTGCYSSLPWNLESSSSSSSSSSFSSCIFSFSSPVFSSSSTSSSSTPTCQLHRGVHGFSTKSAATGDAGGRFRPDRELDEPWDDSDYYTVLRISSVASQEEVKRVGR
eukprot:GHVT01065846.1.p1 GENE.GHVT01065846.1~~GHVT01065846.1.p1  ORF type:complete len:169 (+),score=40.48 GHVT01065846.1:328-834(+)